MIKSIFHNTGYQFLARLSSAIFTFSSSFLLVWKLGVPTYGIYALTLVYISTFVFLSDFGINAESLKKFVDKQYALKHFYSFLAYRIFISIISFILLFVFTFNYASEQGNELRNLIFICSPIIILNAFSKTAQFISQAEISYQKYSIAVIITNLLGLLLVFTLSFVGVNDVYIFTFLYLLIQILLFVLIFAFFYRYFLQAQRKIEVLVIKSFISDSWLLGVGLICNMIMFNADRILLGKLVSAENLGIYSFSYRVFDFLIILPTFVMNAYYPVLLKNSKNLSFESMDAKFDRAIRLMMYTGFLFSVVLLFVVFVFNSVLRLADISILFSYQEMINVFMIFLVGLPLFFITSPISWKIIYSKKYKTFFLINVIAMIFNILLNVLLIPFYGYYASAFITIASEILILTGFQSARLKQIR